MTRTMIVLLSSLAVLAGCKTIPMNAKDRSHMLYEKPEVRPGCPDCDNPLPLPPV